MDERERQGSGHGVALGFVAGALTAFLGLLIYVAWGASRAADELAVGISRIPEQSFESQLGRLQDLVKEQRRGGAPWRLIDFSSVGRPVEESQLREAAHYVRIFRSVFGRNPTNLTELAQLIQASPGLVGQEWSPETVGSECEILALGADSYLLNCDKWAPTAGEVSVAVGRFDPRVERFYLVGEHVVLYVPPWVHGAPMPRTPPPR